MQVDKAPATEFTCIGGEMAGEVFHRRQPPEMMFQMGEMLMHGIPIHFDVFHTCS